MRTRFTSTKTPDVSHYSTAPNLAYTVVLEEVLKCCCSGLLFFCSLSFMVNYRYWSLCQTRITSSITSTSQSITIRNRELNGALICQRTVGALSEPESHQWGTGRCWSGGVMKFADENCCNHFLSVFNPFTGQDENTRPAVAAFPMGRTRYLVRTRVHMTWTSRVIPSKETFYG